MAVLIAIYIEIVLNTDKILSPKKRYMARSQNSFIKKLKAEKKRKKKQEKFQKKMEKKNAETSGDLKDMIAYVDQFGNPTDTPPDPSEKEEIEAEDIVLGIPPKSESDEVTVNEGTVSFFDDSKGFGFIKVKGSQESLFTHVSRHEDEIKEGNLVSFDVEPGDRGPVAVNVRIKK